MNNSKFYYQYISGKYKASELVYKKVFKSESAEQFLIDYESMNVYPTYPRPIIMPLKKENDTAVLEKMDPTEAEMEKCTQSLNKKISEYQKYLKEMSKIESSEKIRRYFDYEIRDKMNQMLNTNHITNGWIKMSEILATYPSLVNKSDPTIDTFHICEHPGKFVFAIKDYIKKNTKSKHHFVFQSLNTDLMPNGFKVDYKLKKDPDGILDYGKTQTGDITDADNIRYYIDKYQKNNIELFTSDCGEDFGDDPAGQESGLYNVYLCALTIVIGIANKGANYVFKFFSFGESNTIELLYITTLFFEKVDIVRLMTTKGNSGENYCVCQNFIPNEKLTVETLINQKEKLFPEIFLKRIQKYHMLLTLRRMTVLNNMIFRFINHHYIQNHKEIQDVIKQYVDFYVKYFINYIGYLTQKNKDLKK